MADPLAEIVKLLQPAASFSKVVNAAGNWRVSNRAHQKEPFYCIILEGGCNFEIEGHKSVRLSAGDFVLVTASIECSMSGFKTSDREQDSMPKQVSNGEYRLGDKDAETEISYMVGHYEFAAPDAKFLVSLLPKFVHINAANRLSTLVQLIVDESRADRGAREVILARLLEVLFIEALRDGGGNERDTGLIRGLSDARLSIAIRKMHQDFKTSWTIAELAKEAGLSRSAFFDRFNRILGIAPMEYLHNWRMALAQNMLSAGKYNVAEVAHHIGYGSASAFSVAFSRHVGTPPGTFARIS